MEILVIASLALALLPAVLIAVNLRLYRGPPPVDPDAGVGVSLLIPARNEASRVKAAVHAALASTAVDLEVIVLDDHSTDRTAALVRGVCADDKRLKLETAPALPEGWSGKQHACQVLAKLARHDLMVFTDADVRLAPDALARIAAFMRQRQAGLVSGFPRQETGTPTEKLAIPLIHFLLLGFLPLRRMRLSDSPSLAAGCGQLIAVKRDAYERAGGHGAVRASLHDGLTLPRAFRRAGIMTDLFDANQIATCRMYRSAAELWRGFSKNAAEGMATPRALPIWTLLLGGGQVLPFVLLPIGLFSPAPVWMTTVSACTVCLAYAPRIALTLRFHQSRLGAALHPIGIVFLLALQWTALINDRLGRPAVWRERAYFR